MARYCRYCENFNTKEKAKEGYCQCKKKKEEPKEKQYVWANSEACEKFENNYGLSSYEKEKLYDSAKAEQNKYKEDKSTPTQLIIVFIILIIVVIAKLLKLY